MTTTQKKIISQAMQLPDVVKAKLAEKLLSSISTNGHGDVRKAWVAEIKRRLQALKRRELRLYDGHKVLSALKKKYQK